MLSMLDKYDSVNECTKKINESVKLYILGVWLIAYCLLLTGYETLWFDCL